MSWKTWLSANIGRLEPSSPSPSSSRPHSEIRFALPTMPRSFRSGHVREPAQIHGDYWDDDDDNDVFAPPTRKKPTRPITPTPTPLAQVEPNVVGTSPLRPPPLSTKRTTPPPSLDTRHHANGKGLLPLLAENESPTRLPPPPPPPPHRPPPPPPPPQGVRSRSKLRPSPLRVARSSAGRGYGYGRGHDHGYGSPSAMSSPGLTEAVRRQFGFGLLPVVEVAAPRSASKGSSSSTCLVGGGGECWDRYGGGQRGGVGGGVENRRLGAGTGTRTTSACWELGRGDDGGDPSRLGVGGNSGNGNGNGNVGTDESVAFI